MYEHLAYFSEGFHFAGKRHRLIAHLTTRARSVYIDDNWKIPQRVSEIVTDDNGMNGTIISGRHSC